MADAIHGVARYPGVLSLQGASYTISHGISPGVCVLKMNPQPAPPAAFGDLIFTDGEEEVVVADCKLQSIKVERDDKGMSWSVEIADRRWRWRELGYINGCYNQMDPFGKLIPWTIRSPTELAVLCLEAMGEEGYEINLPPGLNYPGPAFGQPIINLSGVNPPVDWNGVPPAQALQDVADRCGCRIIYRLSTNSILISPIGVGAALPRGSIHKRGPTLTTPQAPSGVGVLGSPTRYQVRLMLTAVGKEWDGSYRPINLLSYAPRTPGILGQVQISVVTVGDIVATGTDYKIVLYDASGEPHTSAYMAEDGDHTAQDIVAKLLAAIVTDADPLFQGIVFVANGKTIVATGKKEGAAFELVGEIVQSESPPVPLPSIIVTQTQAAQTAVAGGVTWENSWPPLFANVRATDRLTLAESQRLAQESVFRCYQLTGVDVSGSGPPYIPGFGAVQRTQQIVLQSAQVDQIVPEPEDKSIALSSPTIIPTDAKNAKDVLQPLTVNFYNGYSHDKPAAVYGSIAQEIVLGHIWYPGAVALNTPKGGQVHVPFEVRDEFFLIRFSQPVFERGANGTAIIPNLTLQTAVLVRDVANNQLVSFARVRPLPDGDQTAPPLMRHYPDIQANVSSIYDEDNQLQAWSILEADPILRADYYLEAMLQEFQIKGGQIVEYNGIRALDLDGLTQQITWEVGSDGCSTVASQNCEHSIWISPYPARRRAEFLPPVTEINKDGNRIDMPRPPQAG